MVAKFIPGMRSAASGITTGRSAGRPARRSRCRSKRVTRMSRRYSPPACGRTRACAILRAGALPRLVSALSWDRSASFRSTSQRFCISGTLHLRAGALHSVRILNGTLQVGPAVPAPPGPRPRLAITVAQNGSLSTYASGDGKTYVTVPAGPAAVGPPPTRVALTCRGTGSARFAAVSVRPV